MSIKVKTNLNAVSANLARKIAVLKDKEYLLRPLCFDIIDLMTKRIHIDGKDSTGSQIGTYSKGYMAIRTGGFENSKRVTRGKNKGKIKDAGTFTKGTGKSLSRPMYNRSSDTKVIVSLTRQLENDWAVIARPRGYGVGFLNALNFQKAGWVEETYDKRIFHLTTEEKEFAQKRIQGLVKNALES